MSVGGGSRPLYSRVLRLRYLRLRPLTAFLLFEGSVAFAILLVLADLIDGWGIIAIPAAVAVMVKINDVVAGALSQPPDGLHVWYRQHRDRTAIGRSRVPFAFGSTQPAGGPGAGGRRRMRPGRVGGAGRTGGGGGTAQIGTAQSGTARSGTARSGTESGPPAVRPREDSETQPHHRDAQGDAPDGREPRTWAIARVVARGRASVRSARDAASEVVRPDGADRRSRGNTGRFGG
jgi:hypothetical protein